ncbi:MAG TPA: SUMF1/EgtB/PvdO family nonheme iron enzyme [Gemmataceae bacterium]|nr:SUMF1/EgtB/PvdO family nonheme iron enzyme [Gemmataceae bacterium]
MKNLLVVMLACIAGCGKNEHGSSAGPGTKVDILAAIQPVSGGTMVKIPAGTFLMGEDSGRPDETPHTVTVNSFYLDQYTVTQELYEKVMGVNPSKRKDPKNPVERTQWTDAVRFCNKCSEMDGLVPCYDLKTWECAFDADGYRLPTEAEWEYSCRAGGTGRYCHGDAEAPLSQYAWFKPQSQGKPQPVGRKAPNSWGLFDMHGNVWQWCHDWYGETYYSESSKEDPRGPAAGKMRVLRGGAWDSTADKCRSAYRHKEFPVYSDACFGADSYGLRRARKADGGAKLAVIAKTSEIPNDSRASPKNVERPLPAVNRSPGLGKIDQANLKGTIVFVSDRSGTMQIWTMHASGKEAKQLTKGSEPDADPHFAPDGKRILYTALRGGFPEIWLMNRDGSDQKSVTKGSQGSWAPDGNSIIFIQDNRTCIRDLFSGKERLATPIAWERCGVPAFSPDGQRFAVASRHLGGIGIFILSVDGKEAVQLKAEEACCTPQWSKDGKRILCQTVQGHIHQVGVDGKGWDQLTFGADVQHDARYSPDGTKILFCRAPTPEGPWQICVQQLADDEDEFLALTKEGSNLLPDWHPDE